jgi:hypothetical protein
MIVEVPYLDLWTSSVLSVVCSRIIRMSEQAGSYPDPRGLSHAQRLEQLTRIQHARAQLDVAQARLLATIDPDPTAERDERGGLDKHYDREEVALVLRLSSETTRQVMVEAAELVHRFPATLAMLDAGHITAAMVRRLVETCLSLADTVAGKVEDRVLKRAGEQSLSQFGASVRRAVLAFAPKKAEEQHEDAREARRVGWAHQADGTSELWATGLDGADAVAMHAALRDLAAGWKAANPDDERTPEQRQADALVALVLGQPDAANGVSLRPAVNVTVAASTLLGRDEQPGELDGFGAIPAAVARALASDPTGTWRRLLTDANHRLIDVSARTYRPPVNMARLVRAQRPRCCFPGCRRRAIYCELDHVLDWQYGGHTAPDNLQPLCARHHQLKHEAGWTVTRELDGTTLWKSPTGHTYARPPDELPIDTASDPPGSEAA